MGKIIAPFVLVLLVSGPLQAQSVTRGPYLQLQTSNGVSIHWRTDSASDSVVRYGTAPGPARTATMEKTAGSG